jgi:UPF0271 protein
VSRRVIDLNADLGEFPARLADGSDAEIMRYITSANVACGAHAGDALTIAQTVELARQNKVAVGAHPSYPDRTGFGRTALSMAVGELQRSIAEQLERLLTIANRLQIPVVHVKPHGALYHSCNRDPEIARALCRAVLATNRDLVVVGQAESGCVGIYREMGLRAVREAFADRAYEPDGSLRNRSLSGALLDSPGRAAAQALDIAARGKVITTSGTELAVVADTLCIHSDTPGSAAIAREIRERLAASDVVVQALQSLSS